MSACPPHLQLCPRGSRWLWLAQHPDEGEMPWWADWHGSGSQCVFLLGVCPGPGRNPRLLEETQRAGGTGHYQLGLWFWTWVLCQGGLHGDPQLPSWAVDQDHGPSLQVEVHLGTSPRQRSEASLSLRFGPAASRESYSNSLWLWFSHF